MTDRLDAALADLGTAVEFPPTPDLVPRSPSGSPSRRRASLVRAAPRALAVALVALAARRQRRRCRRPGRARPAADVRAEPPDSLGPGRSARHAAGAWRRPCRSTTLPGSPAALGPPDEAYVIGDGEIVSLVYAADDELPELDGTDIGLLVQAIEGSIEGEKVRKLVSEVGARVLEVNVNGAPDTGSPARRT